MLAKLRKNTQSSYLFGIVSILIVLLLFLSSGQDLLHNHKPDLKKHDDCPAHQIFLLFSSTIQYFITFSFLLLICVFVALFQLESAYSFFKYSFYSRAPPFQICQNIIVSLNATSQQITYVKKLKRRSLCLRTLKNVALL